MLRANRCRASGVICGTRPSGRIDQQRCAPLSFDHRVTRAGVDPEAVVAADVAGWSGRPVTANRRCRADAADRRALLIASRGRLLFEFFRLLVAHHQRIADRPFHGRECRQVVRPLEVGMTVGEPRNRPFGRHRRGGFRRLAVDERGERARHGDGGDRHRLCVLSRCSESVSQLRPPNYLLSGFLRH